MRKKMTYYVRKGHTIKEGIRMAMEDSVTKERFFTTPLCLEAVSGKRQAPAEWAYTEETSRAPPSGKGYKGSSKSGKGKAKGQKGGSKKEAKKTRGGKAVARGCATQTPDGANICFRFNSVGGCTITACPYVQVCGKCFASGVPMYRCKRCGTDPK